MFNPRDKSKSAEISKIIQKLSVVNKKTIFWPTMKQIIALAMSESMPAMTTAARSVVTATISHH